ncbi:CS1 type fimbrial major subunit [Ferrimonas balearica]|uniref:CS1 type fimbrial major subunit n=1 Tax=Ferrimonas balearica TaxID=44012 RepID=UPI001C99A87A|nr:CS1 type fimbrial major subunit [Ferrimonas balearica]MBY5921066.1 fimbrial protein [Ferrimonas balearica]MBY5996249.1 fimbrial protein [Ferrimonas balearica]
MKTLKFTKVAALSAAAFMFASFGAQAATKVIQVSASVDTDLSVVDVSGTWDAPIVMVPNATNNGLETVNMVLNFDSNAYQDVNVTLQSLPALVDSLNNNSIPLVFELNGTPLVQNTALLVSKTELYESAGGSTIDSLKNVPLTISSADNTALVSGNYQGVFTLNFDLNP